MRTSVRCSPQPQTPDAQREALHARMHTTEQMQQTCLLRAAAASTEPLIVKVVNDFPVPSTKKGKMSSLLVLKQQASPENDAFII